MSSRGGGANDVFQSGLLSAAEPTQQQPDHYVYDPLDILPAALEQREVSSPLTDQTEVLNNFGNGLIYHSDSFPGDTEITGYAVS